MLTKNRDRDNLSVSSFGKDEDAMGDYILDQNLNSDLTNKLAELDKITFSFLADRSIELTKDYEVFSDIEPAKPQKFEFSLLKLSNNEVMCITVQCVADSIDEDSDTLLHEGLRMKIEHENLSIKLELDGVNILHDAPNYSNGEYEIALTGSQGILPGSYSLIVKNNGHYSQAVKVNYSVNPYVNATSLALGQSVIRKNCKNEFMYFRYIHYNTDKLLSIRVMPISEKSVYPGDPDLFVSNRFKGLVNVTSTNFVWRSYNIGTDQIDISPNDIESSRGNVYIIGVFGYKDINSYVLDIQEREVEDIVELSLGSKGSYSNVSAYSLPSQYSSGASRESMELWVSPFKYNYYSIKLDTKFKGRIDIKLTPSSLSAASSAYSSSNLSQVSSSDISSQESKSNAEIEHRFGRGVYSCDTLCMSGVFANDDTGYRPATNSNSSAASIATFNHERLVKDIANFPLLSLAEVINRQIEYGLKNNSLQKANSLSRGGLCPPPPSYYAPSMPPSTSLRNGIFPVVFISGNCMYPNASCYTWRASGIDGSLRIQLEVDEWRYSTSGVCYLSVIGVLIKSPPQVPRPLHASSENDDDDENGTELIAAVTGTVCKLDWSQRSDVDELNVVDRKRYELFNEIFADVDGANVSQLDRTKFSSQEAQAYTYGEVQYPGFLNILRNAGAQDNQIFVDLGSGVGKAVIAAALSGIKFMRCIGVERLPGLCEVSRNVMKRTTDMVHSTRSSLIEEYLLKDLSYAFPLLDTWEMSITDTSVGQIKSSVSSPPKANSKSIAGVDSHATFQRPTACNDWTCADIVYSSSLCFPDDLLDSILEQCKGLKPNSVFITLRLPSNYDKHFELFKQSYEKMDWGRNIVYYLKRK